MARRRRAGEGTIYQRADGTWTAKVTYEDQMGRTQRKSLYAKTEKEILAKKKSFEKSIERGVIAADKLKVSDWLNTWLETYKKPSVKQNTYEGYDRVIKKHLIPTIGSIYLKDLRPEHIQAMINEKSVRGNLLTGGPLQPRMVEYIYTVLHVALEQAYKNQIIIYNPCDMVTKPQKVKKEFNCWTADQANTFLAAMRGERDYIIYLLALTTGLRRSELIALRWADVDMKHNLLSVKQVMVRVRGGYKFQEPKTIKSKRTIHISNKVVKALKEWKRQQNIEKAAYPGEYNEKDLIFCSIMGEPVNPESVSRNFKKDLEAAKLPEIRFHDLRHCHASMLLERGTDLKTISDRLGHSTITMTADIYSHITDKLQAQAVKSLDDVLKY